MMIYFDEDGVVSAETLAVMEKAALACLRQDNVDDESAELSVTFVTKEEIKELNRDYRGVDSVTDVLSFPQYDSREDFPQEGAVILGDVVICREIAQEQAVRFGHTYEREIIYLFTHSVLHLLGYDHMDEKDKKIMRGKEEAVMDELGLPRE